MIRKKEYTYIFRCKYWKIVFTIPQQSIEKTLEFYDIIERNDIIEVIAYMKDYLSMYWEVIYYWRFWNRKRLLNTFFDNYLEFISNLSKIVHSPYKSKYDWINIISWESRPENYWSNMLVMSKKTWIPVDEILDRLSLQEWWIYQDAIIHENLEIDKKTRKYNDQAEENKKAKISTKQKKEYMKNFREDLKKGKRKTVYVWRLNYGN